MHLQHLISYNDSASNIKEHGKDRRIKYIDDDRELLSLAELRTLTFVYDAIPVKIATKRTDKRMSKVREIFTNHSYVGDNMQHSNLISCSENTEKRCGAAATRDN